MTNSDEEHYYVINITQTMRTDLFAPEDITIIYYIVPKYLETSPESHRYSRVR